MRYKQLLSEQQLDELRMNPSSLRQFVDSPEAEGIQAGFEAELVFTGLGGEPEYDEYEPDMDSDERCRTLDGVVDFFQNDDYGYGINDRQAERLRERLDEMYYEWQDEQMFEQWQDEREERIKDVFLDEQPWAERVHAVLVDGMEYSDEEADKIFAFGEARKKGTLGKPGSEYSEEELDWLSVYNDAVSDADAILDEEVESCISSQDKIYDHAIDEFRDSFYIDDDTEFWRDVGLEYMSDVQDEFRLPWPVMTSVHGGGGDGQFSEYNAQNLADSLSSELGVDTYVSSGYHSATRKPGRWIFEPDSSLDADDEEDMPVEIVSPPMPLKECLRQMENFFAWAESNGAYANRSTGFHIGVSLPHRGGTVDYIKLALFLGDEYVLKNFGRSANHFCASAMQKIKDKVGASHNQEQVSGALDLMRNNLIELATKALKIVGPQGFGKYTSINPKGDYIEFRSAGGTNYFENVDRLKNMLIRYAKAMHVAAEPSLERNEYYKKLYKLIAPATGDASMDLFSRFATGSITADQLKKQWADVALQKDAPELTKKSDWALYDKTTGKTLDGRHGSQYTNATYDEALNKAKARRSPGSSMDEFKKQYELINMNAKTDRWCIVDKETDETLEVVDAPTAEMAANHLFHEKGIKFYDGYYIRPYIEFDQPAKLSRRAELAKRIKAPKPDWNVVYRPTGRVIDTIMNVSREEAQKLLVKVAQQHDFDSLDELELHNKADADREAQSQLGGGDDSHDGDWKLIKRSTGETVRTFEYMTRQEAAQQALTQLRREGIDTSDYQIVPKEEERYSSYADAQRAADQQNQSGQQEVDGTGEPVWEIYEVATGRVVEEVLGNDAEEAQGELEFFLDREFDNVEDGRSHYAIRPKMAEAQPDVAQNFSPNLNWREELRRHIEPSLNSNPTIQDNNQSRMPDGTPVWEVFERDTGHGVNAFAENTMREAFNCMMEWLANIGAEDPDTYGERFGIRPRMLLPGERNQSPTIRESRTAKRLFAEFDAYFESVITPAKKRLK
jgi:hypothetical protein